MQGYIVREKKISLGRLKQVIQLVQEQKETESKEQLRTMLDHIDRRRVIDQHITYVDEQEEWCLCGEMSVRSMVDVSNVLAEINQGSQYTLKTPLSRSNLKLQSQCQNTPLNNDRRNRARKRTGLFKSRQQISVSSVKLPTQSHGTSLKVCEPPPADTHWMRSSKQSLSSLSESMSSRSQGIESPFEVEQYLQKKALV